MELSDFGRRRGSIVVPLMAVPILAATAGAGWSATRPAQYRHSVDIQVPAPAGQAGAAALEQSVSTYRGLVGSARIAETVARQTGVPTGEIRDGLTTQRPELGGQRGGLVRVVYSGRYRSAAPAISRAAALAAAQELVRPVFDSARQDLGGAQAAADSARLALTAAARKDRGLPIEEYRSLQNQIARLEADRDAPSAGRATGTHSAADLDGAIKTRKKRLAALAPRVIEVQALQDQLGQADRTLADAQRAVRTAQARLAAAENSVTSGPSRAVPVARALAISRTAAMCAGVGVLLAVGVLVLLELTRPRHRPPAFAAEEVTQPVERV